MKTCTVCNKNKPLQEFYKYQSSVDGYAYRCKVCDNKAVRKYRKKHVARFATNARNSYLKHRYNLTSVDYEQMLRKQNFRCKICKKHVSENKGPGGFGGLQSFAIDHDHETGKVRGLLCNTCNRGLGLLGDSLKVLVKAFVYLLNYKIRKHCRKEML